MRLALTLAASLVATPAFAQTGQITLDGTGLTLGDGTRIDFGAPAMQALAAVSVIQGGLFSQVFRNEECGAGPMEFAALENGLTLHFQNEALVGWLANGGTEPPLMTVQGYFPGMEKAAVTGVTFEETTLGTEFGSDDVWGMLDESGATVQMLWAGTSCFFR